MIAMVAGFAEMLVPNMMNNLAKKDNLNLDKKQE
jgi:hypothetical protein